MALYKIRLFVTNSEQLLPFTTKQNKIDVMRHALMNNLKRIGTKWGTYFTYGVSCRVSCHLQRHEYQI